MGDTNLIPAERLARRRRKARLCLWTAACGTYLALLCGSSLALQRARATQDRNVNGQLAAVTRQVEQDNKSMLKLRRELAETTTALETTRAIREQPDWSRLFLGLAEQMGDEVVISRCQLMTLTPDGKAVGEGWIGSSGAQPLGTFLTECRHTLTLQGFGKTQESVSRFVLRLEGTGAFDQVRLGNSSRQTFLDGQAVGFSIECRF
jgi:Tfp pilus assembly protein PilN